MDVTSIIPGVVIYDKKINHMGERGGVEKEREEGRDRGITSIYAGTQLRTTWLGIYFVIIEIYWYIS